MAKGSASDILRPVGKLEQFSTARHSLGYYRCVANTARYTTNSSQQDLPARIETAVAQVVLRHPALCCGILNENTTTPSFVRLDTIDLSVQIEYHSPNASDSADYESKLWAIIEQRHRQLWTNLDSQPGWRVIIVQNGRSSSTQTIFDAIFAFHHAPIDGLSGMVFHRSMLEVLNAPKTISGLNGHHLQVLKSIVLAPAVEKAVEFKISWYYFLATIWKEFGPKWFSARSTPWTAGTPSPSNVETYRSRVKAFTISAHHVAGVLSLCRKEKATITGLLHGLVVVSLTSHIPSATSITCTTPYSLRHLTGLHPTNEMGNNTSALDIQYFQATLSNIRACKDSSQTMEQVWIIARDFRSSLRSEMSSLPTDNIVGMLPYVSDVHGMFTSRLNKPRSTTYEISNLGSLDISAVGGTWAIDRILFTQSGNLTGPAINFNVANVARGFLTVSATWLEGDVEDSLVEALLRDVEYSLKKVAEGNDLDL